MKVKQKVLGYKGATITKIPLSDSKCMENRVSFLWLSTDSNLSESETNVFFLIIELFNSPSKKFRVWKSLHRQAIEPRDKTNKQTN